MFRKFLELYVFSKTDYGKDVYVDVLNKINPFFVDKA